MRVIIGLAATIGLLGSSIPATVTAAAPTRHSAYQAGLLCEYTTELGDVLVQIQDFDGFVDGGIVLWAPDAGPDDPPTLASLRGSVTLTGSLVEATFELAPFPTEEDPEPRTVGTASVRGTVAEIGDPTDLGSRTIRDGNRRYDLEITSQLWTVDGTLTLDLRDGSVRRELDTCGAGIVTQTTFGTNPNAYLTATRQLFISCSWTTERGAVGLLSIVDDYNFLTQVTVVDGDRFAISFDSPNLTEDAFSTSVSFEDPFAGVVLGTATAEAAFEVSRDRIAETWWDGAHRFSVVGDRLAVDGTMLVTFDGTTTELTMDDASCEAGSVLVQVMEKMPRR